MTLHGQSDLALSGYTSGLSEYGYVANFMHSYARTFMPATLCPQFYACNFMPATLYLHLYACSLCPQIYARSPNSSHSPFGKRLTP